MPKASTLAQRIRAARLNAGLSQSQFARLLEVSASLVAHWENGIRVPSIERVLAMARTTNAPPAYLLLGDGTAAIGTGTTAAEDTLIRQYRRLDAVRQQLVLQAVNMTVAMAGHKAGTSRKPRSGRRPAHSAASE